MPRPYKEILATLIARINLSEAETAEAVDSILEGAWSEAQIAAFLAALATKGETVEELAGAAHAMRRKAVRVQAVVPNLVDTCGTGGDGANTFNISTTAAFIAAGAGATVAKHGNRAVSSGCGSADVLEALGLNLQAPPEVMQEALNEIGIAFLFAPLYHGAIRHAMPVRKQLGVRTVFNMLGPLTNPAGATAQLLGVFSPTLTEAFAHTLKHLGTRRAFVVHGHDGLDEISVCAPTRISELRNGQVVTYDLDPHQFLPECADPTTLKGGSASDNASILRAILDGTDRGPRRHVALLNAAAALIAVGLAPDWKTGLDQAAAAVDSGAALTKLETLAAFTQRNA